jgi:isoleucyl-tRNA synthetase
MTEEKMSAYQTLYHCLVTVAKLMAPIAPFYADRLYLDLVTATGSEDAGSVHLADFPRLMRQPSILPSRSRCIWLRRHHPSYWHCGARRTLKVRQPLMKFMIPVADDEQRKISRR